MKIAVIVMAVVCVLLVPFTAVMVYRQVASVPAATREVFAEEPEEEADEPSGGLLTQPAEDLPETYSPAALGAQMFPVSWSPLVLYDPAKLRVYLPLSPRPPSVETNYFYNVHTITLASNALPGGGARFGGGTVRGIDVYGKTIEIHTVRGTFAEVKTEDGRAYVQLTDPRDIYKTIVVVDPGHGGIDIGAPNAAETIFEKDINLSVVLKLTEMFDRGDILILPTRTDDVLIDKDDRAILGNMMGDYFISVHCNADEVSRLSAGTVTYYSDKDAVEEETDVVAAGEVVSEADDGDMSNEILAQTIQSALSAALGSRDRGIVIDNGYRVLSLAQIPAVISEMLFMTNAEDLEQLTNPASQAVIAEAYKGVIEGLPGRR